MTKQWQYRPGFGWVERNATPAPASVADILAARRSARTMAARPVRTGCPVRDFIAGGIR
jgi:hypothetical protein